MLHYLGLMLKEWLIDLYNNSRDTQNLRAVIDDMHWADLS